MDEGVWMKVCGGLALLAGCVYMPTDSVAVVDSCYDRLKEDVLGFGERRELYIR